MFVLENTFSSSLDSVSYRYPAPFSRSSVLIRSSAETEYSNPVVLYLLSFNNPKYVGRIKSEFSGMSSCGSFPLEYQPRRYPRISAGMNSLARFS